MAKSSPLTLMELSEFLPRLQATVEVLAGEAAHAKAMARQAGERVARGAAKAAKAAKGVAAKAAKGIAAKPAKGVKGAKAGKRRRGRRMTPEQSAKLRQTILSTLSAKKGLALGEVIKRTKGDHSAVSFQLRRLRTEKKARVVGDRQLARWFSR